MTNDRWFPTGVDILCAGIDCERMAYVCRIVIDRGIEGDSATLDLCYQCNARLNKDPRLVIEDEGLLADIAAMELREDALCGNCGYAACGCCPGCGEIDCFGRCAVSF